MEKSTVIQLNSEKNFEYAKHYLVSIADSGTYSPTWAERSNEKRALWDLLPVFWLTPLSYGVKELEENECDRFLHWVTPIFNDWPAIQKFPRGSKVKIDMPVNIYQPGFKPEEMATLKLYERIRSIGDIDFNLLPPPSPVGCITYESADGYFFNANTLKYLYQYSSINNLIGATFLNDGVSILEIGGGYGGFAHQVIHQHDKVQYIIIDLPETLIVSMYYLRKNFPHIPMGLYKDFTGKIESNSYRLHFIPSCYADKMCGSKFDIALNSNSLLEMRPQDIESYMDLIQNRNQVTYFYNHNMEKRKEGGVEYRFDQLPYDDKWTHLLDRNSLFVSAGQLSPTTRERLSVRQERS